MPPAPASLFSHRSTTPKQDTQEKLRLRLFHFGMCQGKRICFDTQAPDILVCTCQLVLSGFPSPPNTTNLQAPSASLPTCNVSAGVVLESADRFLSSKTIADPSSAEPEVPPLKVMFFLKLTKEF